MRRWNSTTLLFGGLIALLCSLGGVKSAEAGDRMRVCVLEIEGARNDDMQNDLIRLINQPYQILGDSTFYKAAKRMRIGKKLTPKNLRRLADFLKLGAVIDGTLVAKNGRYRLVLKVRDARTGAITERIRHTLRDKEMSSREKNRIRRDMINALERIRLAKGGTTAPGRTTPAPADEDEIEDLEEDVEDDVEELDEEPLEPKKSKAELRAERRRKAREAREAKKRALAEKRRKAREERLARKKAEAERRRKAREERLRKRREARERKRREAEERRKRAAASDEEGFDDLEDEEGAGDLEDEEGFDDLEDEEGFDDLEDGGDLEDEEDLEGEEVAMADEEDEEDLEGEVSAAAPAAPRTGPAGLVANAGLGATSRSLTFDTTAAMNAPIDYASSFVPAAFVEAELYPLGFGEDGVLANLGIDASFEQAILLSSEVDPDGTGTNVFEVDTTYRRYGAGLRYRMGLGPAMLALRVGYGKTKFVLDKPDGMMVDIPNTIYTYVDPGLELRYPMGKLALGVGARFLAVLNTGEIQQGDQYGRAKVLAFDTTAGLEYALSSSLGVRLGARLAQMGYSFEGNGAATDRDGDGMQDVDGASDRYLGGYLTAIYRL